MESILNKYTFLGEIGVGGSSVIYEVLNNETQERCVCKAMSKSMNADPSMFMNEIEILKKINHPNIVKFIEYYQDDEYFLVFEEYCKGETLLNYINGYIELEQDIDEQESKEIMHQLLSILAYLQTINITHRDIKPENIIIDASNGKVQIKLIDFGLATDNNVPHNELCGSLYYMAPELLKGKEYIGSKIDIWAAGVVFYILMTGQLPFDSDLTAEIPRKIASGHYEIPMTVPLQVAKLISRMLDTNQNTRADALSLLSDQYFQKSNIHIVLSTGLLPLYAAPHTVNSALNERKACHSPSATCQHMYHQQKLAKGKCTKIQKPQNLNIPKPKVVKVDLKAGSKIVIPNYVPALKINKFAY